MLWTVCERDEKQEDVLQLIEEKILNERHQRSEKDEEDLLFFFVSSSVSVFVSCISRPSLRISAGTK